MSFPPCSVVGCSRPAYPVSVCSRGACLPCDARAATEELALLDETDPQQAVRARECRAVVDMNTRVILARAHQKRVASHEQCERYLH